MHVYQEAYGFTRLRLLVDVFEGWLGLLVLARDGRRRDGCAARGCRGSALLSGAALLLGLAALNPDAWIAEHNLDRYAETGKVDWSYLQGLSDDAVPVLADARRRRREPAPCRAGSPGRRRLAGVEPGAPPGGRRPAGPGRVPLPVLVSCGDR